MGHACSYDVLGEFMEYLARNPVMKQAPSVLVAYLGVLTSLASGPAGAQVSSAGHVMQLDLLSFHHLLCLLFGTGIQTIAI